MTLEFVSNFIYNLTEYIDYASIIMLVAMFTGGKFLVEQQETNKVNKSLLIITIVLFIFAGGINYVTNS